MNKIILSLAGVLAAVAFAPEASAVPSFARQTGMACSACHFQHFPLLNSFGRAFKAGGFTMMGAQGKVEGEHLSIPNTLNVSALATAGYNIISDTPGATASNGSYMMPNGGGELSLFFGGRISENAGFLSELAFPDNSPSASGAKLPMLWDVGSMKAGVVFMANNAPAFSLELLNTGAVSTHRMMGNVGTANTVSGGTGNHINATSASQYLGTKAGGHGVSFVATSPMFFVNIGKYDLTGGAGAASAANAMNTTYLRGAYLFDLSGWDTAVGVQSFTGTKGAVVTVGTPVADTKATIFDAQMQGEAGGMPLGIYVSLGSAPKGTTTAGNLYNAGTTDKKSTNIAVELGVIPHVSTVQLAFRSGKNGAAAGAETDNALMFGVTYELAMNVELSLTHTANSGNAYDVVAPALPIKGKTQTTLLVEALF